jgi:hypothetical protein
MAYALDKTGKEAMIRELHSLAIQSGKSVVFDEIDTLHYSDLVDLKHDLLQEIQGQLFIDRSNSDGTR